MVRFYDQAILLERLTHAIRKEGKRIVFLVGAPLAAAELPERAGVANVSEVIDLIRNEFGDQPDALARLESELATSGESAYQRAFEFLIGARGQDAANGIVRKAVLRARQTVDLVSPSATDDDLDDLERDLAGWILPTGVRTLGKLVVDYPKAFGSAVLTSNFDPLIEISIRKHGGNYYRTVLHRDGDLGQTTGDGCHIVHLHGYWTGRDTLHTPRQLQQERPRLRQSLARILKDTLVVVLAYGG